MGELALVLGASASVILAIGTAIATVVTAVRASPKERKNAAEGVVKRLVEAAKDGQITPEELQDALTPNEDEEQS